MAKFQSICQNLQISNGHAFVIMKIPSLSYSRATNKTFLSMALSKTIDRWRWYRDVNKLSCIQNG